MSTITIIGAGNAGVTMAAHLKLLGFDDVRLCGHSMHTIGDIIENRNRITLHGDVDVAGEAEIDMVSADLSRVAPGTDVFVCVVPAHHHRALIAALAKHCVDGQILWFHPGRTGAVWEAQQVLRGNSVTADVGLIESETLLYACRRTGVAAHVYHVKEHLQVAGASRRDLDRFAALLGNALPTTLVPSTLLETSLNNIGMLFHPLPTIMNLTRMQHDETFDYYVDGMTSVVVSILEKMDVERLAVAAAYGVQLQSAKEWLWDCYESTGETLYDAIRRNGRYVGIKAPHLHDPSAIESLRYITEDVPCGLVPIVELGHKAGVAVPVLEAVVTMANAAIGARFWETGRTLARLGLADLTVAEITSLGAAETEPRLS